MTALSFTTRSFPPYLSFQAPPLPSSTGSISATRHNPSRFTRKSIMSTYPMRLATHADLRAHLSHRSARNYPWVDVSRVRNALLNNHFIDILETHAVRMGLMKDPRPPVVDANFSYRMQNLSLEFRAQVTAAVKHALGRMDGGVVDVFEEEDVYASVERKCACTKGAMENGAAVIVSAVLGDPTTRIFARVPLLLRLDIANRLFKLRMFANADFDLKHAYIPMATKRASVMTNASWVLKKSSSTRLQLEMQLWDFLLAVNQQAAVDAALVMALHPSKTAPTHLGARFLTLQQLENDEDARVFDQKIWRLATVHFSAGVSNRVMEAIQWRADAVDNGAHWIQGALEHHKRQSSDSVSSENAIYALAKYTTDFRKRPNMKCGSTYDEPWSLCKKQLAMQLCELTSIAGIGHEAAKGFMEKGVPNDYSSDQVTPESLGIYTPFIKATLEKCKPRYDGPLVTPELIPHNKFNWRRLGDFSEMAYHQFDKAHDQIPFAEERTFFVDMELASMNMMYADRKPASRDSGAHVDSDLGYQFSFPGYVFMIGCGRVVKKKWQHVPFIANSLSQAGESAILRQFLEYVYNITAAVGQTPIFYVWGPEKSMLKKAKRRMSRDDAEAVKRMVDYRFVDMLQVALSSGLSIKGVLNNSINNVAKGLHSHGLLDEFGGRPVTHEVNGGSDVMGLVLTAAEAMRRGEIGRLADSELVQEVVAYNEDDCRDVARVFEYLRTYH